MALAHRASWQADEKLGERLESKYEDVFALCPKKFKTATGSYADGILMVPSEQKVYLLEAKYTGDVRAFLSCFSFRLACHLPAVLDAQRVPLFVHARPSTARRRRSSTVLKTA